MVNTNKTDVLTSLGRKCVLHRQGKVYMFWNDWNIVGVSFAYFTLFYTDYHRPLCLTVYPEHNYCPGGTLLHSMVNLSDVTS